MHTKGWRNPGLHVLDGHDVGAAIPARSVLTMTTCQWTLIDRPARPREALLIYPTGREPIVSSLPRWLGETCHRGAAGAGAM